MINARDAACKANCSNAREDKQVEPKQEHIINKIKQQESSIEKTCFRFLSPVLHATIVSNLLLHILNYIQPKTYIRAKSYLTKIHLVNTMKSTN